MALDDVGVYYDDFMGIKAKSDIARVTKAALHSSSPDERGLLLGNAESFEVAVGQGSVARTVAIVDGLIGLLKKEGYAPTLERVDHRTKHLKLDGEAVRVRITEELDRTRHVPTKEEQERLKERFPYPRVPTWDYQPTGRLSLTAAPALNGRSETWTDRQESRLEDNLPRIAKAIRQLVVDQRTRRTEMEQQARLSAEREHACYEAEALERKREEYRRALVAEARQWQEASLLRDYARELQIEAACHAGMGDSPALTAFVEDLLDAADRLDPTARRLGTFVEVSLKSAEYHENVAEAEDDEPVPETNDALDPCMEDEPTDD